MKNIVIVGHGVVGKNLERELRVLDPDVLDKYKPEENCVDRERLAKAGEKWDAAFICVDTPMNEDSVCDVSEVENAIRENDAEVYIIKSTVLPGTTERLRQKTGKRIIFSPEYYGGTQHCNNFQFNFTVLGGEAEDCQEVVQMLQRVYDATHTFRITDSTTAELVKYMENSWLATKVSFCGQFFLLAESLGVRYEELRELFILDPRVNPSHTFVYRDKPYWDSHCLNKDVPAIAALDGTEFLRGVIEFNRRMKERE